MHTHQSNPSIQSQSQSKSRSRFITPWRNVASPRIPTLAQARGRVLYSPTRTRESEGIGHAMAAINADISAAMRLNVAYSHRVGYHGSLTKSDKLAVERFFGWNDGVISRENVSEACDYTVLERNISECVLCEPGDGKWRFGRFEQIVDLPVNLAYKHHLLDPYTREYELNRFLKRHNKSNTLFQMPPEMCDKSPVQSYFGHHSRAYFYNKYWNRRALSPATPEFYDDELTIAVHVRRGDFFLTKRPMMSMSAFGNAIRQIQAVVLKHGGPFARMQVGVVVYSEGTPDDDDRWHGHDVNNMIPEFLDITGEPRDEAWVREQIVGRQKHLFPNGLRIDMRIATDTLEATHEMIAADVFLGSQSGLSVEVVGTLSRAGIIALPSGYHQPWHGHCPFWPTNGLFNDVQQLRKAWAEYAEKHQAVAQQALVNARMKESQSS